MRSELHSRSSHDSAIPRVGSLDSTMAFLREGYAFIGTRCRRHRTDAFETRLMLRKVVCMTGRDAARAFYTPDRFTRRGAMPQTTLRLLQDLGSVQWLDGVAHRHRKQLFLPLMDEVRVADLVEHFTTSWLECLEHWERQRAVVLHDEVRIVLCRAVCRWAGIPLAGSEVVQRTRELAAMIDGAGGIGPRTWRALLSRRRTERWARGIVQAVRDGSQPAAADSVVALVAGHHGPDGRLLDPDVAAVELLNVLRPTVAVSQFITFAAFALHQFPSCAAALQADDEAYAVWFAEEVRRYFPFFPAVGGRVVQPFEWHGHTFAQGDWVLFDLFGTNHDARIWGDPERFRPERFRNWAPDSFALVPQGAGHHHDGHRCPGEAITVALVARAARLLTTGMRYEVPPQDLRISLTHMPARPASGFVIARVRRA